MENSWMLKSNSKSETTSPCKRIELTSDISDSTKESEDFKKFWNWRNKAPSEFIKSGESSKDTWSDKYWNRKVCEKPKGLLKVMIFLAILEKS